MNKDSQKVYLKKEFVQVLIKLLFKENQGFGEGKKALIYRKKGGNPTLPYTFLKPPLNKSIVKILTLSRCT